MTKASRCPLRSSASQFSYHKLENKEFAYVCLGFSLKLLVLFQAQIALSYDSELISSNSRSKCAWPNAFLNQETRQRPAKKRYRS